MRGKSIAVVRSGAFASVALATGVAQAGHHQTRTVPVVEETVAGGPDKPVTVTGGPCLITGAALGNPGPLG
jgi:hypothetical protein